MKHNISRERIKELLSYDESTGLFIWKHVSGRMKKVAGTKGGGRKYRIITIDGHPYALHQLAWIWVTGSPPRYQIDHINGNADDNRIENLRDVPQSFNRQNLRKATVRNCLGVLGVSPSRNKFMAVIKVNGKSVFLGRFDTKEKAYEAYAKAKRVMHSGCTI